MSETPPSQLTNSERPAAVETEVEAKQGTDKPKGMPVVLIVSTVAAAVAMWAIWATMYARG